MGCIEAVEAGRAQARHVQVLALENRPFAVSKGLQHANVIDMASLWPGSTQG